MVVSFWREPMRLRQAAYIGRSVSVPHIAAGPFLVAGTVTPAEQMRVNGIV